MKKHPLLPQGILNMTFIRFIMVGVINTTTSFIAMCILLNLFDFNYWWGTSIGNVFGFITSFILNKTFTFRNKDNVIKTFIKFFLLFLISYSLSYTASLYITNNLINNNFELESSQIKNIAAFIGFLFFPLINFFGQKYFVFNDKKRTS